MIFVCTIYEDVFVALIRYFWLVDMSFFFGGMVEQLAFVRRKVNYC